MALATNPTWSKYMHMRALDNGYNEDDLVAIVEYWEAHKREAGVPNITRLWWRGRATVDWTRKAAGRTEPAANTSSGYLAPPTAEAIAAVSRTAAEL